MNERFIVNFRHREQCIYSLKNYIISGQIQNAKNLTMSMFMNGLSKEIYDTCIEMFFYYSCIYIPDYISILLTYEQNISYYYRLVLHLTLAPKKNIFQHFPKHKDYYFYLLPDYPLNFKRLEDNTKDIDITYDKYYKSVMYYLSNINLEYQDDIHKDFSDLLYFLYFHSNYEHVSKTLWYVQFNLFKETEDTLIEFVRMLNVLEDFFPSRKLKILMIYYSLHFRFLDIEAIRHIFKENVNKVNDIINPKIVDENYIQ